MTPARRFFYNYESFHCNGAVKLSSNRLLQCDSTTTPKRRFCLRAPEQLTEVFYQCRYTAPYAIYAAVGDTFGFVGSVVPFATAVVVLLLTIFFSCRATRRLCSRCDDAESGGDDEDDVAALKRRVEELEAKLEGRPPAKRRV